MTIPLGRVEKAVHAHDNGDTHGTRTNAAQILGQDRHLLKLYR